MSAWLCTSPNEEGGYGAKLSTPAEAAEHCIVTNAAHAMDPECKICMQILHSETLAQSPNAVVPPAVRSRLSPLTPAALDDAGIDKQLDDFARCARMAKFTGYDGVEVIGSAGYLLSTFLLEKTNRRDDHWGGSYKNRMRFPLEVITRIRAEAGDEFILIFRIAAMDMLPEGLSWDEVVTLAQRIEGAGADIISTHFTWHEAAVPTIAAMVPRAAFASVTGRLRKYL